MSSPGDRLRPLIDVAYLLAGADATTGEIAAELLRQFPESSGFDIGEAIATAHEQILAEAGLAGIPPGAGVTLPNVTNPQWEGEMIYGSGDSQKIQYLRVERLPGDTAEDVRIRLELKKLEIETIIAERGGADTISGATIGEFWEA